MKVAFMIGTNDVGGAEYVSYQHVLMAQRNGMNMVVLSGGTGKFHDLLCAQGIKIEVIGFQPSKSLIETHIGGCDVVFNCNFFGILKEISELRVKHGFASLVILHNDTNWIYNNVILKYDQSIDLYYSIHQRIVDSFVSKGFVPENKFVVIPNCVDSQMINDAVHKSKKAVRQQLGIGPHSFVIGMITRVAADKNILDALKIIKELPSFYEPRLLIVGGPAANHGSEEYFNRVKREIRTDTVLRNRVIVTGNKTMSEVYTILHSFDLGLNCSPSEGLPIAMLEMMAAGVPCVMPSIGDIPGELTGRGVVVPIRQRMEISEIFATPCYNPKEIKLFVDAINDIHIRKTERYAFGAAAKEYINENRSLQVQEKLLLKFLDMGATKSTKKKSAVPVPTAQKVELNTTTLPKVTVLMPTRDGNLAWMQQAIESILLQDYPGEMDLLIVNHDCRLSMTAEIIKIITQYNQDQTKVKINYLPIADGSLTFSEILDLGVNQASGEIILRMDHDDVAERGLVSASVDYLVSHPEIHVVGVQLSFFEGKQMVTHHAKIVTRAMAYSAPGWWFINHPGVAMRKETLLKVGGYGKVANGMAEDYTLWCKFLIAGYEIANLPDVLMFYRSYHKREKPEGYTAYLEQQKRGLKQ